MFKKSYTLLRVLNKNAQYTQQWRFRHKINERETKPPPPLTASADVINFIRNSSEYNDILEKLPKSLLKKYKTPESMYLIDKSTAKDIAKTLKNHLNEGSPVVEVNPGFGFLTSELLNCHDNHIYMYETSSHFSQFIDLQQRYPKRITYKVADFFGIWKLAFQDKLDNGSRIKELLGNLATDDENRMVNIVGSMPGLSFVKHLIYDIVFNHTSQLGKPNLFITMPGHHYEFLTDSTVAQSKHRSIPALFQLLFECSILGWVLRVHFLPWTHPITRRRVSLMDEQRLLLVNIRQRGDLPCAPEDLPLLWYFFRPHTFSNSTRVIPMLEQWIPGCGVWLISGQDPPDVVRRDGSRPSDDAPLPHLTIFTEFGDLTLQQKLTIFKRFISWPEFEASPFRVTMENNLPKSLSPTTGDDEGKHATIIDDLHEDSDNEDSLPSSWDTK